MMIIKFWEKKKSIPIKGMKATIIFTVILLIFGGLLISCAINPPTFFPFLKDGFNRLIYAVIGAYIIFLGLKLFFTRNK